MNHTNVNRQARSLLSLDNQGTALVGFACGSSSAPQENHRIRLLFVHGESHTTVLLRCQQEQSRVVSVSGE